MPFFFSVSIQYFLILIIYSASLGSELILLISFLRSRCKSFSIIQDIPYTFRLNGKFKKNKRRFFMENKVKDQPREDPRKRLEAILTRIESLEAAARACLEEINEEEAPRGRGEKEETIRKREETIASADSGNVRSILEDVVPSDIHSKRNEEFEFEEAPRGSGEKEETIRKREEPIASADSENVRTIPGDRIPNDICSKENELEGRMTPPQIPRRRKRWESEKRTTENPWRKDYEEEKPIEVKRKKPKKDRKDNLGEPPKKPVKKEENLLETPERKTQENPVKNHRKKKRNWEEIIGKIFMPCLAALLVFFSAVLFGWMTFPYLNDTGKSLFLFAISLLLSGCGYGILMGKEKGSDSLRYIGQTLLACGISFLFLTGILSCLYYKLFDRWLLLVFFILWMAGCIYLRSLKLSEYLYIAGIGLLFTVFMVCDEWHSLSLTRHIEIVPGMGLFLLGMIPLFLSVPERAGREELFLHLLVFIASCGFIGDYGNNALIISILVLIYILLCLRLCLPEEKGKI